MVQIPIDEKEIAALCQRWRVFELSLFGSVLRDDFGPDSDVDVLARFSRDAGVGLSAMSRLEHELEQILGREVHLVDRTAVERSRNYLWRKAIPSSLERVYAAQGQVCAQVAVPGKW